MTPNFKAVITAGEVDVSDNWVTLNAVHRSSMSGHNRTNKLSLLSLPKCWDYNRLSTIMSGYHATVRNLAITAPNCRRVGRAVISHQTIKL